jgi:hypothetical protein
LDSGFFAGFIICIQVFFHKNNLYQMDWVQLDDQFAEVARFVMMMICSEQTCKFELHTLVSSELDGNPVSGLQQPCESYSWMGCPMEFGRMPNLTKHLQGPHGLLTMLYLSVQDRCVEDTRL